MNFVYISPNFPANHRFFCKHLKKNGVTVLGIGDCPYDNLHPELKESLNEYYKVSSLEHYDEVYRAVAFFIHKYGRIDYLESNNEYWLEQDAALRKDFNITTIKLDKSLLNNIGITNSKDEVIIRNVVKMANELNKNIVAEGVETEVQAEYLKSIQCNNVQGFLFDRPLAHDDFEKRLSGEYTY